MLAAGGRSGGGCQHGRHGGTAGAISVGSVHLVERAQRLPLSPPCVGAAARVCAAPPMQRRYCPLRVD